MSSPTTPVPEQGIAAPIPVAPVALVHEVDDDRASSADSSANDSAKDGTDRSLEANAATSDASKSKQPKKPRDNFVKYFNVQKDSDWSWDDYKEYVQYSELDDDKKCKSQASQELGAANYLQAFQDSMATLEDETADDELSRRFEENCAVETWPGVDELLSKVFGNSLKHLWEESLAIVRGLPMDVALNRYLFVVFDNYARYFKHHKGKFPDKISEREGWGNITWPIISGALDILDIDTRSFEVMVKGNEITRHFKAIGDKCSIMADGVGISGSSQIYVAEASQLLKADFSKKEDDYQKLMRAMGDLAIEHRKTKVASPSPTASTVYGSQSYKDRTRFFAMDATTSIPLRQLDLMMIVPLTEADFPRMLPNCLRVALRFAWIISQEHKMRESMDEEAKDSSNVPIVQAAETSLNLVPATAESSSTLPTMQATEPFLDPAPIMQTIECL
ncbi:hypothetical protein BGZ70_004083 [Mortierella alpina]|uniref:Uncharacterized protein n=1 Tax=Mortierella alpina TaxID=64518 RepID=A0A9P6IRT8_MORAP|nr:hypothetical protein BGZ70_004083 [Mortierella alpina]